MKFSQAQQQAFLKALTQKMPYGKYQRRLLMDLPGHYLAWFKRQGFPDNALGRQLALVFELDHNGLLPALRQRLQAANTRDTE
ncbi:DUF3820 family protein [Marinicella meishanensis]|uniref:DUF3820 family protein n=1 Tax=Marinicella meishanensis TaxID=2873263 RepID=UPI001CC0E77A|nr:DUF3820 family protein [Marinicella sp. NBU2979]